MNDIKVKIFSDSIDISMIKSAVKQLELKGILPDIVLGKNLVFEREDILIFQIIDLKSRYLNKISIIKNEIANSIIFVTPESNAVLVSSIIKMGFKDIYVLPFEQYGFISRLSQIANDKTPKTNDDLDFQRNNLYSFNSLIGESAEFTRIISLAKKISENSLSNLLIRGETGTGKGMLARAIHSNSKNSEGPFVEIVCSSLPENLLESELFGHEEGAFTSAQRMKQGLFELAENGTIFLDEIGDLSINVQRKLLRSIETKMIRRLGAVHDTPINARIIAATNMNLEELVEQNLFRRDLYHRLNVVTLELPPLRLRENDVFILAQKFMEEYSSQFDKKIINLDDDVKRLFMSHKWPGNVRELKNSIERAVLLANREVLSPQDFINFSNKYFHGHLIGIQEDHFNLINLQVNITNTTIYELDKLYAKEVLKKINSKSKTAKLLGVSRPKLDSLLR